VQLRGFGGTLPFCLCQAPEESALQLGGVRVSEMLTRLGQNALLGMTFVYLRAALLATHPDAVPE